MSSSVKAPPTSTDNAVEGTWSIGPRELPPPAGASKELCAILAGAPAPQPLPVPATVEQFKALCAKHDEAVAAAIPGLAAQLKVKIEQSDIEGVPVYHLTPSQTAAEHAGHLFVFVHGGGFAFNAGLSCVQEGLALAAFMGLPVISIDYRMPPDHPAPAAVDDIVTVWQRVTADRSSATTAFGGTSAGGNLALAATLKMKDLGLGLPGALFAGTPEADLNKRGDSLFTNDGIDNVIVSWDGLLAMAATYYAGDLGFDHPSVSPILGDFSGFPPTYLITGTRDLFLSNTVRAHRRLRQAGVAAELHVYEGFSHGDYDVFPPDTPECAEHYKELNAFLLNHLPASEASG